VSANTAAARGGGVTVKYGDNLTVENSTISGNTTTGEKGGGIFARQTPVTVRASTISGNMAPDGTDGTGGGLYLFPENPDEPVAIENSTIAGNSAGVSGGGIRSYLGPGPPPIPTISNSIVADNTAPDRPDLSGTWNTSFLLLENTMGSAITETVASSNITGKDPKLGALAANGGPTKTRKPAANSPVLDKGSSAATTDQRGKPRPFDVPSIPNSGAAGADAADIGAVELTVGEAAKCAGKPATILAKGKKVKGTPKRDVIVGTKGKNVIRGRGGNDVICGGKGNDRLIGGPGRDRLLGQAGQDTLIGGPGKDKLKGGPGADTQRQ
jgi:Ca2+-binding RTX toxin-like protein